MKPLVLAMEGNEHLVKLAIRTLEYWIDSLNPEFLEPAMASVADRLLAAIASHLQLPPYPFGTNVRLDQIGGRKNIDVWGKFLREMLPKSDCAGLLALSKTSCEQPFLYLSLETV